jgi:hypothetical protein
MLTKLSVLIFASTLLSGCFIFSSSSPPRRETSTTTTTTVTCPAGTRLQSDGMCR